MGGETLTYRVSVANETIATAKVEGTTLIVEGRASGTTTAVVEAGDAKQTIAITVRKVGENGWM